MVLAQSVEVLGVAGAMLLFIVVTVQLIRRKSRARKGQWLPHRPIAVTGMEELLVLLSPAKRIELEQRTAEREQRDDDHDGAPPGRVMVDLEKGIVRIRKQ